MVFGFNFLHRLLSDVHTPHYLNEVALVGNAADKPTGANAKDNMLFYEQDTGLWKRYRSALSEWVIVGGNMVVIGKDYQEAALKNVGIDPETKALLIKGSLVGGEDGDGGEHEHPEYVKKAGDTMTGLLTLSGAPTANLHAATKKYVDDQLVTRELFFGRLTSDQDIGAGGGDINIDTADVDTLNGFDAANHRYVIQKSGYKHIEGQMWIDGGIVNMGYQVGIRINNAPRPDNPCTEKANWMCGWDWWRAVGVEGDIAPKAIWGPKYLNKDDYVKLWCWNSNITVQGTEPYCGHKTFLSVIEV